MSAQEHQHGSSDHPHGGSDHHEEPAEETLAADEAPTPLWLPVIGAILFFVGFIVIAAF